jgi:hypothetical protein
VAATSSADNSYRLDTDHAFRQERKMVEEFAEARQTITASARAA